MNLTTWRKKYNIPTNKFLIKKTLKYKENKDWYLNSNKLIKELYNNDYKLFIKLLALTSPRNTVKRNTYLAIKTFKYIKQNKSIDFSYGIANKLIRNNLDKLLKEGNIGGVKVNSFISCLNLIDGSICIDVWVMKAFNLKRIAPLSNDIVHINTIVKHISNTLSMATYEVQSCLWTYAKRDLNTSVHKEYKDFSEYL